MLERLEQLERNVAELEKFKTHTTIDEIKSDLQKQWVLRYGLFESIQIVIDLACHISSYYNLGNPKIYSECIELLVKNQYLSHALGEKLKGMVGLRNLLTHEYVSVDIERLFHLLDNLDDFIDFAEEVKRCIRPE